MTKAKQMKLEMKNPGIQTQSSEESLTNKLNQEKEKLSGLKDKIEEMDLSVKC